CSSDLNSLLSVALALPALGIRDLAIAVIVFVDQAASCLGCTLTLLRSHTVRLLQAAVLATAVRRGLIHARHGLRIPLERDPTDGDLGTVHRTGLPQRFLTTGLSQSVCNDADSLVILEVGLQDPAVDLLPRDDERARVVLILVDLEVGETALALRPHRLRANNLLRLWRVLNLLAVLPDDVHQGEAQLVEP